MSSLRNHKLFALGIALAICLVTVYVNNRYDSGITTHVDVKADRGMFEKVELVLPHDLWPRQ